LVSKKGKKRKEERKRKLIHLSPVPFAVGARAAGRGGELVPAERASPQGQQQPHLVSLVIFLLLLLPREIIRFFFPVSPRDSKSLARLRNLASSLVFIIISELGTIGIPHGFYFIIFFVLNCLHKR
jgi:hypothetical protein